MRQFTTTTALVVLASLTAACAGGPAQVLEASAPPSAGPCAQAGWSPEQRRDCAAILAEVSGQDEVTLEFSDRYQAIAVPIQIWTRSWITHVDFVLPDGRLLGATPLGVRVRPWTPPLHAVRYSFKANASTVYGFALAQLGKRYDYIGNIGYALRVKALHDDNAWFCSELVEAAALAGGVDLSGKAARWTSPARLQSSRLLVSVDRRAPAAPAPTTIASRPQGPEG